MHRIKYTYSESVEKLKQVAVNTERTFAEIKGLTDLPGRGPNVVLFVLVRCRAPSESTETAATLEESSTDTTWSR